MLSLWYDSSIWSKGLNKYRLVFKKSEAQSTFSHKGILSNLSYLLGTRRVLLFSSTNKTSNLQQTEYFTIYTKSFYFFDLLSRVSGFYFSLMQSISSSLLKTPAFNLWIVSNSFTPSKKRLRSCNSDVKTNLDHSSGHICIENPYLSHGLLNQFNLWYKKRWNKSGKCSVDIPHVQGSSSYLVHLLAAV